MELTDGLFSGTTLWWVWICYALFLLQALSRAPWRGLLGGNRPHVFFGTCVALLLLWNMRAEVNQGLIFHLLGISVVTLMFGWSLAVIAASIALVGVNLNTGTGWESFALNVLVLGVLPATLTQLILIVVRSLLPKNFFIYVLVNGFLTAGLVMLVSCYLAAALLVLSGGYDYTDLSESFLPFVPLMAMPEAFLNGWIITVMVVFRPNWVYSFSDELYIKGK